MQVYKLVNNVTGKAYIGATSRPIGLRLLDHWSAARQGRGGLIREAIREFGQGAFSVEILGSASSLDELMEKEVAAIREHGTLAPDGYNMAAGGRGTPQMKYLESSRLKMSEAARRRASTPEGRAALMAQLPPSKWKRGYTPWNKGKNTGPAWNRGIPHTAEAKAKMSDAHKGAKNWSARAIELDGVSYPSITDACTATGLTRMQVSYRLQKGGSLPPRPTGRTPTNAKPVEFGGVTYSSISAAARAAGMSLSNFRIRLKAGRAQNQ